MQLMRHRPSALIAVALVLGATPTALAQDAAIIEDPCGDTSVSFTGTPVVPLPQSLTWTDLSGLTIQETEESFLFTVHYCADNASMERGSPTHLDVYFEHNGQTYWLDLYSRELDSGAALYRFDLETRDQRLVGPLDRVVDDVARTYSATIPRSMLLDASGAPPFPGRQLVVLFVESFTIQFYSDQAQVNDWDRMPDSGMAEAAFDVKFGATATGTARLISANPSRASNGAAASYVYELIAANDGAEPESFRLDASNVPSAWNLELPISAFTLAANQQRILPVIVTTPFAHQHGARETALVTMTSLEDDSNQASVNLNIVYHDVPQPAGHHDTLYLHSRNGPATPVDEARASSADVFMNTLMEDPEDALVNAFCSTPSLAGTSCGWDILLSPGLQIGLDFNLEDQGELVIPIGSAAPLMGASLTGELRLASRNSTTLAQLGPAIVETTAPNAVSTVRLPFSAAPEADFIQHDGSGNLILSLTLDVGHPVAYTSIETPFIAPGGYLTLPLNEYREPFAGIEGQPPILTTVGPSQRRANPGDTLVFELAASQPVRDLTITGVNSPWASLAQRDGTSYVIVRVPGNAGLLDLADLIIQGTLGNGDKALARIIVIADDASDYPDDADLASQLGAPGRRDAPLMPMALLALAFMFVARRRR